jgi:hypothetical protein
VSISSIITTLLAYAQYASCMSYDGNSYLRDVNNNQSCDVWLLQGM